MAGYKDTRNSGEYRNIDTSEKTLEYRSSSGQLPSEHGPIRDAISAMLNTELAKKGGSVASSPVIHDGVLFFGAADWHLYALDSADGTLLWKFKTNGPIYAYPCVAGNAVYFRAYLDNFVYAVSLDGNLLWKSRISSPEGSGPVVVDDVLYVGAGKDDQHMYAISAKDGSLLWKYRTNGAITSTPAVVNDTIFFGAGDGYFYALSTDGKLKWKFRTSDGVESSPAVADANGDAVWSVKTMKNGMTKISEGVIYFGSWDNHVYALTLDGRELWRYRTGGPIIFSSAAIRNKTVYIGSFDGHLYALDAAAGSLKWKFRTGMPITADPVINGDDIYVGSLDNCLYAISSEGKELWKFWTGGYVAAAGVINNGSIYFGSWDCYLYALSLGGGLVWKFKVGKLEPLDVDVKTIMGRITEMNKRIFRIWKPETSAGKNDLVFSDLVSVSPLYRSALAYSAEIPYKSETAYTATKKKKNMWLF